MQRALFLDRDGVINMLPPAGEYVLTVQDFFWAPKVKELVAQITKMVIPIFVVTNQQCVGKELMAEEELLRLHTYMVEELQKAWWSIEKVLYCPHLQSLWCSCRKPKPGMLLSIFAEYPTLVPEKCLFVWDSLTDIEAGKAAGVQTLLIEKNQISDVYEQIVDFFTE